MTTESVELHPLVKKIAKSFVLDEGFLTMPPETANALVLELSAVKPAEREDLAVDIVALATRFRDDGGKSAEGAIGLLIAFTVAVLGDAEKAADVFNAAGMAKAAASVIGSDGSVKAPTSDPSKPATVAPVKAKRGLSKS